MSEIKEILDKQCEIDDCEHNDIGYPGNCDLMPFDECGIYLKFQALEREVKELTLRLDDEKKENVVLEKKNKELETDKIQAQLALKILMKSIPEEAIEDQGAVGSWDSF